jgi:hypothetical protein
MVSGDRRQRVAVARNGPGHAGGLDELASRSRTAAVDTNSRGSRADGQMPIRE